MEEVSSVGILTAATPKENEKQPGRRRDVGKLSMLLDMPFDILYEVSHGIIFVADNGMDEDAFGTCRYPLMSVRWIYCECRGSTKLFVMFSHASPRGVHGWPLSITSPKPNGHLRVQRTWRKLRMQTFCTTRVVWCVRVFILRFTCLICKSRVAGNPEVERIGWLV